jgi:hypothetical protein
MQTLQTRIEAASDRLIAEALSKDASLAAPIAASGLSRS